MAVGQREKPPGARIRRMDGKKTAVVTESAVQAALRRGPALELAAEEEKAMRMRLGASLPRAARLERKVLEGTDAELELLAIEIEAHLMLRGRTAPASPPPAPRDSRTKEKIVRALRRKS
jgi:hypothetical protein